MSKECMRVHTLLRLDNRPIGDDRDEIRAFMTVRDEMLRLPQNLNHHRSIGVTRFFVVDNGSTDGSREFLLAQPDCHLFLTHNSYAESRYGLEWQHAVLDEYGTNHWCLIIDADEWFIYPGYERKPLPDLAAYWTAATPKAYSHSCSTCTDPAPLPTQPQHRIGHYSTPAAILTASTSGAAGFAFLACKGHTSRNIMSLAARDGDCSFHFCTTNIIC